MLSVSFSQNPLATRIPIDLTKKKEIVEKPGSAPFLKNSYMTTTMESVLQLDKPLDIQAENKKYHFSYLSQNTYTEYVLRKEIQHQYLAKKNPNLIPTTVVVKENGEIWEGTFNKAGLLHGTNCTKTIEDITYKGHFNNGDFVFGTMTLKDGETREGLFQNWVLHGDLCSIKTADGVTFEGHFYEGYLVTGTTTLKGGEIHKGTFQNGKLHGDNCKLITPEGTTFEGNFHEGNPVTGTMNLKDGETREGTFQNWMLHGDLCSIKIAAGTTFKGHFEEGRLVTGTMTFKEGEIQKGTFQNEQLHGDNCERITPDGTTYEGHFNEGLLVAGTMTFKDGQIQKGTFQNGMLHGNLCSIKTAAGTTAKGHFKEGLLVTGTMTFKDGGIQKGTFQNEQLHGDNCKLITSDGTTAEGHFKEGLLVAGTMTFKDGQIQKGTFQNGMLHGNLCSIKTADGTTAEGHFKEGLLVTGTMTFKDGQIQKGTFQNEQLHGDNCKLITSDGTTAEGHFKEGLIVTGTMTFKDGQIQKGTFQNGQLHGDNCKLITPDGTRYEGHFNEGHLVTGTIDMLLVNSFLTFGFLGIIGIAAMFRRENNNQRIVPAGTIPLTTVDVHHGAREANTLDALQKLKAYIGDSNSTKDLYNDFLLDLGLYTVDSKKITQVNENLYKNRTFYLLSYNANKKIKQGLEIEIKSIQTTGNQSQVTFIKTPEIGDTSEAFQDKFNIKNHQIMYDGSAYLYGLHSSPELSLISQAFRGDKKFRYGLGFATFPKNTLYKPLTMVKDSPSGYGMSTVMYAHRFCKMSADKKERALRETAFISGIKDGLDTLVSDNKKLYRLCEQGQAQYLLTTLLQGRLKDVMIDEIGMKGFENMIPTANNLVTDCCREAQTKGKDDNSRDFMTVVAEYSEKNPFLSGNRYPNLKQEFMNQIKSYAELLDPMPEPEDASSGKATQERLSRFSGA